MSARVKNLINRFILQVILSAIISCDTLESDFITPENQATFAQSDYYTLPGSTIIIDLKSIVKESFNNATLTITENPKRGTLTRADPYLYKFKPAKDFEEGEDHFVLALVRDGKVLTKGTMTINMRKNIEEFPCAVVAVEDKMKLKPGSSPIAIHVLANDLHCDVDILSLNISIHTPPQLGQAIVENGSIVYTPGPNYTDADELIYQVTGPDESIFYGLASMADRGEFLIQSITGREFKSIFFIDENKGFVGTDKGIYKTINGGANWSSSLSGSYCMDIFFLNETKGFAVMGWDSIVSTNNGGATWELLPRLGKTVTKVTFTSENTGFIAASDGTDFTTQTSILKTVDGGKTWREVFSDLTYFGYLNITFMNPNIGYAVFYDRVVMTTDAGETWKVTLDKSLNIFDATSENKLFGVPYDEDDYIHSTIITSEDGNQWKPVADLPYNILSLGFSPAGDVGFASLFLPTPPPRDNYSLPLSIVRTIDGGKTWVEQNVDRTLHGFPVATSIPSNQVVYFLCPDRIIKYSYK